MKIEQLI